MRTTSAAVANSTPDVTTTSAVLTLAGTLRADLYYMENLEKVKSRGLKVVGRKILEIDNSRGKVGGILFCTLVKLYWACDWKVRLTLLLTLM